MVSIGSMNGDATKISGELPETDNSITGRAVSPVLLGLAHLADTDRSQADVAAAPEAEEDGEQDN